ncbi:hypothetical protein CERSUDRAFT_100918 [Gelatoporia subvermispora B]|uniref:Uncharacterized protein n=1 Tax=Ceriporiopsis subvermispora (strain B) TaxID=914234 RepID=M2QFT5_CERS8|nr:hypothetical protein CERSUDRAFT_100918 [Gelatoporia subvermispora B]
MLGKVVRFDRVRRADKLARSRSARLSNSRGSEPRETPRWRRPNPAKPGFPPLRALRDSPSFRKGGLEAGPPCILRKYLSRFSSALRAAQGASPHTKISVPTNVPGR